MSNPESITVSLEWAKELKEAGWLDRSALFFWTRTNSGKSGDYFRLANASYLHTLEQQTAKHGRTTFAAPTAEELLRRLPNAVQSEGQLYYLIIRDGDCVSYESLIGAYLHDTSENGLRNSLASMYCYLADHNLLTPTP